MLNVNESSFNFGSGTVSYKGTLLGESRGSIKIKRKTSVYDVKKDSSSITPGASLVTGIKMEISMTMVVSDAAIDEFFNREHFLQYPEIGSNLNSTTGELVITTGKTGNQSECTFPYAILQPDFSYEIDGEGNHLVEVMFYTFIEANHMNVKCNN
jgi:hypothetical protein